MAPHSACSCMMGGTDCSSHYHNTATLQLLSRVTWADLTVHHTPVDTVLYRWECSKYLFVTVIVPTLTSKLQHLGQQAI